MTFSIPSFTDAPGPMRGSTSAGIAERITQSVLAQRLAPGTRLGEQALAGLFGVSRTPCARSADAAGGTRHRHGVGPARLVRDRAIPAGEASQAFAARRAIELGLLRYAAPVSAAAIDRLQAHVAQEQARCAATTPPCASYLLGDFHMCLGECVGNVLLADTLRDLTARTTLIAMRYQSSHQANESCAEHVRIVAALARGDTERAIALMDAHPATWRLASAPPRRKSHPDPLRQALRPLGPRPEASTLVRTPPTSSPDRLNGKLARTLYETLETPPRPRCRCPRLLDADRRRRSAR
ncbi:GntR family transcriptional regulator [Cupriavidus basilensis]